MRHVLDRHIRREESRAAFEADVIRCECGRAIQVTESQCKACREKEAEIREWSEFE